MHKHAITYFQHMMIEHVPDNTVPVFAWDRRLTAGEIREVLRTGTEAKRRELTAWILREAPFAQVWDFISPRAAYAQLPTLSRRLGRRRGFWQFIFGMWHELGKV